MQVRVYATLRDLLGTSRFTIDLATPTPARQILTRLTGDYPPLAEKLFDADSGLSGYVTVLLNGRSLAYLDGLDTLVEDADKLSLFPPVGGG